MEPKLDIFQTERYKQMWTSVKKWNQILSYADICWFFQLVNEFSRVCLSRCPVVCLGVSSEKRHCYRFIFVTNKCVHVVYHRQRRDWQQRGQLERRHGISEWGNWNGSRKRYNCLGGSSYCNQATCCFNKPLMMTVHAKHSLGHGRRPCFLLSFIFNWV